MCTLPHILECTAVITFQFYLLKDSVVSVVLPVTSDGEVSSINVSRIMPTNMTSANDSPAQSTARDLGLFVVRHSGIYYKHSYWSS